VSRILVLGSLNVDLVLYVDRFPVPGETVRAQTLEQHAGGKGANQACAVARLGGSVSMLGCVGDDAHGAWLCQQLADEGVDVTRVQAVPGVSTGTAVIQVDAHGQNHIVLVAGANGIVPVPVLTDGHCLLLQLEIPVATVEAAALQARARGMTVILDPAPSAFLPAPLIRATDWITPNESELLSLYGKTGAHLSVDEATVLGRRLLTQGARGVVVKLGEAGALLLQGDTARHVPAFPVTAVDTTAAGDAFNGAFAVALDRGHAPFEAARYAAAAAAASVTRAGAQSSMPTPDNPLLVEFDSQVG
jgi:ribokinase